MKKSYCKKKPFLYNFLDKLQRLKSWYLDYGTGKKFNVVEIETIGLCNRTCVYCPVSKVEKRSGEMEEETFKKIIHQLKDYGFNGSLRFHFYNEPLLDKRISKFIYFARKVLPQCELVLFTNGDLLTAKTVQELCTSGLDAIIVSGHDIESYEKTSKLKAVSEYSQYIHQLPMYNSKELMNRGGSIELPEDNLIPSMQNGCNRVMSLVISYTGNIVLCCNDFYETNKLGNIHTHSIDDIWNSPTNSQMRKDIFFAKYDLEICKQCTGIH